MKSTEALILNEIKRMDIETDEECYAFVKSLKDDRSLSSDLIEFYGRSNFVNILEFTYFGLFISFIVFLFQPHVSLIDTLIPIPFILIGTSLFASIFGDIGINRVVYFYEFLFFGWAKPLFRPVKILQRYRQVEKRNKELEKQKKKEAYLEEVRKKLAEKKHIVKAGKEMAFIQAEKERLDVLHQIEKAKNAAMIK